jgi:hypothetical protein
MTHEQAVPGNLNREGREDPGVCIPLGLRGFCGSHLQSALRCIFEAVRIPLSCRIVFGYDALGGFRVLRKLTECPLSEAGGKAAGCEAEPIRANAAA